MSLFLKYIHFFVGKNFKVGMLVSWTVGIYIKNL